MQLSPELQSLISSPASLIWTPASNNHPVNRGSERNKENNVFSDYKLDKQVLKTISTSRKHSHSNLFTQESSLRSQNQNQNQSQQLNFSDFPEGLKLEALHRSSVALVFDKQIRNPSDALAKKWQSALDSKSQPAVIKLMQEYWDAYAKEMDGKFNSKWSCYGRWISKEDQEVQYAGKKGRMWQGCGVLTCGRPECKKQYASRDGQFFCGNRMIEELRLVYEQTGVENDKPIFRPRVILLRLYTQKLSDKHKPPVEHAATQLYSDTLSHFTGREYKEEKKSRVERHFHEMIQLNQQTGPGESTTAPTKQKGVSQKVSNKPASINNQKSNTGGKSAGSKSKDSSRGGSTNPGTDNSKGGSTVINMNKNQ